MTKPPERSFFRVTGSSTFPIDMLRYDRCWPATTEDAVAIGTSLQRDRTRMERTIHLVGLRPPTIGRWQSFMWSCVEE